jgi:hypothetical protein
MFGTFDVGTYNSGLNVGRRLIATGNAQASLPLFRELFAGAAARRRTAIVGLIPEIQNWIVPILPAGLSGKRSDHSQTLSKIISELASQGQDGEAVRVLVTAMRLNPAESGWLLAQAKSAFANPMVPSDANVGATASRLMNVGLDYLKMGAADGITLMGAAHRVGDVPLPVDQIVDSVDFIPDSNANWLQAGKGDAQAVTDYAYDLHRVGWLKTAVGVGTMITPMLGASYVHDMMLDLAVRAGSANTAAVDASRNMMTKGYVEEGTDLLITSGAVTPELVWQSLQANVVGPSADVSAPAKLRTFTRAVSNAVMRTAPTPPESKAFYFALEGEGVRCNEVMWNAEFDLVFNYDSPPPQALVEFYGKRFEVLKNSEATLEINVHPVGVSRRDNIVAQEKTFKDGKMQGDPIRFKLKAPEKGVEDHSKVGVYVTFSVNRNSIYKTFIPIRLVEQLGVEPCERSSLDLDLEEILNGASRPRDAAVFIYSNAGGWDVSWTIHAERKEITKAMKLSMAQLEKAYGEGFLDDLRVVARKTAWNKMTEDFMLPDEEQVAQARNCLRKTMAAGSKLHEIFCREPVFKELIGKIDQLPEGSRIAFHTEESVFPWELIYPAYYDDKTSKEDAALNPLEGEDPGRFWGARFHIESLLIGGNEKSQANGRQSGKLHVSTGLNPTIDQKWKETLPGPVERQREFFKDSFDGRWDNVENSVKVLDLLKKADPASMIYFYCHGSSSELDFGDGKVEPHSVLSEVNYPHWPIIFINACDAGNISPLSFISFRTRFSDKKAAGIVAPSFPIPTLFAAYFASAVMTEYNKRRPIGEIIFGLRRMLLEKDNPLGLWYSVQCPLDVIAPEA